MRAGDSLLSFIMVVELAKRGPRAKALLTYGETGDPTSPLFFDQTELFSAKRWRPILFIEEEVRSDPGLRTTTVSGPRPKAR